MNVQISNLVRYLHKSSDEFATRPVEVLSVNWHNSAYFLEETFLESLMHLIKDSLIVSFVSVNSLGDSFTSGFSTKVLRGELFV